MTAKVGTPMSIPTNPVSYTHLNIEHKNFGRGQVVGVDRERGTFTVFFGKNGTRTLTMQILKGDTVRKI